MDDLLKDRIPKMLFIVSDRRQADKVGMLLRRYHVPQHYQFLAEGTASSEWKDLLGIGSSDKTISICIGPRIQVKAVLRELAQALKLNVSGNGIAFLLPLSGVGHPLARMISKEIGAEIKKKIESEVKQMETQSQGEMIWAILNQGYSEEVMESAYREGAMGGTVIHARRVGPEAPMKFWGISVQEEKEIIFILTDRNHKKAIMQNISVNFGIATEAQGIVFSLPVEEIIGIQPPKDNI